jgi:hypothetical protein
MLKGYVNENNNMIPAGQCKTVMSVLLLVIALFTVTSQTGADDAGLERIALDIRERQVQIDGKVIRVTQGQQVELVWTTDESVQLHLHGYDIEFEVKPDTPVSHRFEAHATGRFPITSHGFGESGHGHETLLYFEVYPD